MDKLIARQGEVQEKLDAIGAWELDHKLERAMDALRCPPPESKIEHLSGGEKRRVALCRLLLQEPDVLLLDEPTNHLDAESVLWLEQHLQKYAGTVIAVTHRDLHSLPTNHLDAESVLWLEQHLQKYAGTVIAVTHDRYFLDNVAGWILELDRGEGIPWKGNYTSWLEQKTTRLQQEE